MAVPRAMELNNNPVKIKGIEFLLYPIRKKVQQRKNKDSVYGTAKKKFVGSVKKISK